MIQSVNISLTFINGINLIHCDHIVDISLVLMSLECRLSISSTFKSFMADYADWSIIVCVDIMIEINQTYIGCNDTAMNTMWFSVHAHKIWVIHVLMGLLSDTTVSWCILWLILQLSPIWQLHIDNLNC